MLDAMGRQEDLAAKIIGFSGGYLFSLKDNLPGLANQVSTFFTDAVDKDPGRFKVQRCTETSQKQDGVVEQRWITAVSLDKAAHRGGTRASEWPEAMTLVRARRRTEPTTRKRKATEEFRYFITSVNRPAERLHEAIVMHWSMEIVHIMLDVGYKEDPCGIAKGYSAENLSTMRKPGLNLIVPIKQLHPGESVEFLLELLRTRWACLSDVIGKPPWEVMSLMGRVIGMDQVSSPVQRPLSESSVE
jgi:predicted transposase YbfD/YdcC